MKSYTKRIRVRWDWRLKWYPIIVIPMMVYLNVVPARVADGVAAIPSAEEVTAKAQSGATPVQGVNAKGAAYVWERNPKYPMIEFVMILTSERR